jgi:hypothetical protein
MIQKRRDKQRIPTIKPMKNISGSRSDRKFIKLVVSDHLVVVYVVVVLIDPVPTSAFTRSHNPIPLAKAAEGSYVYTECPACRIVS